MLSTSELKEFPRQKISYRAKQSSDWQHACVDSVISECNTYGRTRRSDARTKIRNYNLFNNKIDKADFEYVLNPFNLSKEVLNAYQFPASLQPYDVVSPIFMLLFGEESKRPFDPIVMAVNADAVSQKLEQKKESVLSMLQEMLIGPIDPNSEEQPPTPEQVLKYAQMSERDMREVTSQHLLNYYLKRLDVPNKFQMGWKDALIAGEEIYSIDEAANAVRFRRVNPLDVHFILPPNSDIIDDADKIYERNRMSISQIIDEFYEVLTPAQIDDLENYKSGVSTIYNYSLGGPSVDVYFGQSGFPTVNSIFDFDESTQQYGIDVHRVRWKSKRKLGTYHYIDPQTQEEQEVLVDEFFNIKLDGVNEWVEWFWVNEYWEGTRIGQDLYLNVRPRKQQFRSVDNLSECKSGYVGTIYNSLNSQSVSLMDRVYPWLCMYLIVWYRTELLMAANLNKLAFVDVSLIPDGWEMEKWLYYAQSMKIGFVNSYNEGQKGERIGRVNQSTQNRAVDLETGNSIQYNIQLLGYIEQKMKDTAGITDQRLGAISASELVGNTERSVVQSSHITEEWFRVHNHTKLRVCDAIIAVAKSLKGSKVLQYITDDLGPILFQLDQEELNDWDYGVFTNNGSKEQEALATLKSLLNTALQSDKISMSEIVDVINSNSIGTLKAKLKQSEAERAQQAQAAEEQNQQLQAQEMLLLQEQFERELAMQQYKIDTDNETKIAVAEIGAFKMQQDLDQDDDGIIDPTEVANIRLKEMEIRSKENIEKLKIQQTDVQNKSQEAMQRKQIELKEKELKVKEKIEKIKARRKPKSS
jgi:hypothetical protein